MLEGFLSFKFLNFPRLITCSDVKIDEKLTERSLMKGFKDSRIQEMYLVLNLFTKQKEIIIIRYKHNAKLQQTTFQKSSFDRG